VAVKDAVDDIEWSRNQIQELPDGFAVYSGSDGMTHDIVAAGGVGVVSVAAHLAGLQIREMVEATIAGDEERAARLDGELRRLYEALFLEPNPMPLKAGLNDLWRSVGEPRLPLIPASDETTKRVREAVEALSGG
jgi:4-hydroxy-tetrahydrodipicolinate synthase